MLTTRIDQREVFHEHATAERMAAKLSDPEDDWTYTVVYASEKWAYVSVKDEEGEIIGRM